MLGTTLVALLALTPAPRHGSASLVASELTQASPKCGLGAAFHAGRRAALAAKLDGGVVLVRGEPKTRDYSKFRQNKVFWYLTGVESPNAALVIDLATKEEILFLPERDTGAERWEGELWDASDEWVRTLTGFRDVRPLKELDLVLAKLTAKEKRVWISKEPHVELAGCCDRAGPADRAQKKDVLDGRASREEALEANLRERYDADVKDLSGVLDEIRRVKTAEEIDALRRAGRAGAEAMKEAMRSTRPGLGEGDIEAVMSFVHRIEGGDGPAYHAIVGSGPNALVLHYSDVSRRMNAGEMLLVDYAPELDHYDSDITRSWPVDGVFTPRMAEIYDAVLAAQEAGIAAVKPGVTMRDVERACRKVLDGRGMGKLMPHGACHYIGLEVHDVGNGGKPVEPGVAFTVEPGVYDPEAKIGVRIEDVVVVTATGCEVVSAGVPKDRASIVALWKEDGVLDRMSTSRLRQATSPSDADGGR